MFEFLKPKFDIEDKTAIANSEYRQAFSKTLSMFSYKNLPETIPSYILELYLQHNKHAIFTNVNDKYYIFFGGWGGVPNEYYIPTRYIVANPYLKLNKEFTIGKDCVLLKNDDLCMGLTGINSKYANMLAESFITINLAEINMRAMNVIVAEDGKEKASAEMFIDNLKKGKLSTITSDALFNEAIHTLPLFSASQNYLTQLIEMHQYLKSSWLAELGINSNFNMKREALNSAESALNIEQLEPFIDNMYRNRTEAIKQINEMYGLDISVDYNSAWKNTESVEGVKNEENQGDTEEQSRADTDTAGNGAELEQ